MGRPVNRLTDRWTSLRPFKPGHLICVLVNDSLTSDRRDQVCCVTPNQPSSRWAFLQTCFCSWYPSHSHFAATNCILRTLSGLFYWLLMQFRQFLHIFSRKPLLPLHLPEVTTTTWHWQENTKYDIRRDKVVPHSKSQSSIPINEGRSQSEDTY